MRTEIVSDAEIERVHGNANFGPISKRHVVDESVDKIARGFHIGGTARAILLDHGLIRLPRRGGVTDYHGQPVLTAKGRKYQSAPAATEER